MPSASAMAGFVLQMSGTTESAKDTEVIHAIMEDRKMSNPKSLSGSRIIAITFLSALITACSVADYKKPVSDFSAAAEKVEATLVDLNTLATNRYQKNIHDLVSTGEYKVKIMKEDDIKDCQLHDSKRCRLLFLENGQEKSITPEPAIREVVALSRSLRTYANNLSAIVEADTAIQVEARVNETLFSLGRLEDTVKQIDGKSEPSEGKFKEYATPVSLLINWVVGHYVAKVKINALKYATNNAKEIVTEVTGRFQVLVKQAEYLPKKPLAEEVSKHKDKFEESKKTLKQKKQALKDAREKARMEPLEVNQQAIKKAKMEKKNAQNALRKDLKALIEVAKKYDEFLLAKHSNVFARFREAHNTLADNLQDEKVSLVTVYAKISVFLAEAKKLAEIVKKFSKVN